MYFKQNYSFSSLTLDFFFVYLQVLFEADCTFVARIHSKHNRWCSRTCAKLNHNIYRQRYGDCYICYNSFVDWLYTVSFQKLNSIQFNHAIWYNTYLTPEDTEPADFSYLPVEKNTHLNKKINISNLLAWISRCMNI